MALAWVLGRPGVTSAILGTRNEDQRQTLQQNHADLALADDDLSKLDAVSGRSLLHSYQHQGQTPSDRLGPADLSLPAPRLKT